MDRFRNGTTVSPLRQVESYWTALRAGAAASQSQNGTEPVDVPWRSQVDPRGIGDNLKHTFILERIAPGVARFRLAGQNLIELAGMELRGMPVSALLTPAARSEMSAVLETVFDGPAIAELSLSCTGKFGLRRTIEARMNLLPLRCNHGLINRAMGVFLAEQVSGQTPLRFDITERSLRKLDAAPAPVKQAQDPVAGFAEAQAPLSARAPHLRLVKSDK